MKILERKNFDKRELSEIRSIVIEDLIDRFHVSSEEANHLYDLSSIDKLLRKFPYHARHYPIEMISIKIWSSAKE